MEKYGNGWKIKAEVKGEIVGEGGEWNYGMG